MPKTTQNIAQIGLGKAQWYPSSSNYQPTSSAPATAAQFDIHIPETVGGDWISNSVLNPYIVLPLISSSYTSTGFDEELVIRFFTSSHFTTVTLDNFTSDGGGWNVNPISASLYYTSSNVFAKYRDVLLTPTASGVGTATLLRNTIYDLITGSSAYKSGMISASKQGNFISSVFLTNAKGKITPPTAYTGSLAYGSEEGDDESFSINIISTGSGTLNFSEQYVLSENSASLSIQFDEDDPTSVIFLSSTSSKGSDRPDKTVMYFSSSGAVGFNTDDPKTNFDIKSNSFKIRSIDGKNEFQMAEDGRITNKKYADSATSESIGAELLLSYTPGTFDTPTAAQVGETIGTINFLDESYNKDLEGAASQENSSHLTSGSIAQITSTVRTIMDSGAVGDFQIKLNSDPETAEDGLSSFLTIDPVTHGQTVLFPYGVTSDTNIIARGNIVGNGATDLTSMSDGTFAGTLQSSKIRLTSTGDASVGGTGHAFQAGTTSATNIIIDNNEIMARNNGAVSNLNLNPDGGTITFHNNGSTSTSIDASGNITASGNISASGTVIANKMAIGIARDNPTDGQLEVHGAIHVEEAGGSSNYLNVSVLSNNNAKILARGNQLLIKNNADFGVGSIDLEGQRINLLAPVTASGNISSSGTITANSFVGSLTGAVTGDATGLTGTPDITVGNITATGTVTAQEFHTEFVSASIMFDSGSTKFGDTLDDVHSMTGSLNLTGSQNITGDIDFFTNSGNNYGNITADSEGLTFDTIANRHMRFMKAGVETMRINTSGNVGIGTTTPTAKITLADHTTAAGGIKFRTAASSVSLWSAGSGNLNTDKSFNVGSRLRVPGGNAAADPDIGFSSAASGTGFSRAGNDITFITAATERMRLLSGGNVGIGTTTPPEKLTVEGNISASGHIFSRGDNFGIEIDGTDSSGPRIHIGFDHDTDAFLTFGAFDGINNLDTKARDFHLFGTNTTTGFYFDESAGKFGIGTSTPTHKLHIVDGSDSFKYGADIGNGFDGVLLTGGAPGVKFAGPGDDFIIGKITAGVAFFNDTDSNYKMILNDDGNLGIGTGTTSPPEKLTVEGNISASGDLILGGAYNTTYKNDGFTFTTNQDYNVKSGTNKILDLHFNEIKFYTGNTKRLEIDSTGDATFAGDVTVGGTLTAQEFHTEFVSASIMFESGSTKFGDTLDDVHSMTGSLLLTGSQTVDGNFEVFKTGTGRTVGDLLVDHAGKYTTVGRLSSTSGDVSSFKVRDRLNRAYLDVNTATKYISFNPEIGDITMQIASGYGFKINTNQFIVSASGNVGIGTATPTKILDVSGTGDDSTAPTIRLTNTINNNAGNWDDKISHGIEFYSSDPSGTGVAAAIQNIAGVDKGGLLTGNLVFKTRDYPGTGLTEKMRITEDGNVGIGTTTPTEKLHVVGNITSSGKITVGSDGNGSDFKVFGEKANTFMQYDASEEQLTIKHPKDQAGLTVFTTSSASPTGGGQIRVGRDAGQYIGLKTLDRDAHFIHRQDETDSGTARTFFEIWDSSHPATGSHQWAFRSADGSGENIITKMVISSSGNVGIGTTSPTEKLHVDGNVQVTTGGNTYLKVDHGNVGFIKFTDTSISSPNQFLIQHNYAQDNDFRIARSTGGVDFVIDSDGNTGIGTTSPPEKLTVAGNISSSGNILAGNGSSGAPSFTFGSNTNTGMFRPSPSQLGLVAGGVTNIQFGTNAVNIKHAGSTKLATTSTGVDITGDITATGTITAQEFHTEFISSSILFESGSTKFGDTLDDLHSFTGSVDISSSLGRVRIGNEGANAIHVHRPNTRSVIDIDATAGRSATLNLSQGGTTQYYVGMPIQDVQSLGSRFAISYQGAPNFVINGNAGVGINVVAPQADFDVSGSILASGPNGHITASGNISASGTLIADQLHLMGTSGNVTFDSSTSGDLTIDAADDIRLDAGGADIVFKYQGTEISRFTNDSSDFKISTSVTNKDIILAPNGTGQVNVEGNISASGTGSFSRLQIGTEALGTYVINAGSGYSKIGGVDIGSGTIFPTSIRTTTIYDKVSTAYSSIFFAGADRTITFMTSGSNRMKIDSDGNVGIGTTSPLAKLHIDVTAEDNQPAFKVTKVSDNNENAMEIHHGTSATNRGIADFTNSVGSVMFLRGDGNIGIGTTNPGEKLHVDGNIKISADRFYQMGGGNNKIGVDGGNAGMHFHTGDGTERMIISGSGNVGIGTTTPPEKLTVTGDISASGDIHVNDLHFKTFYGHIHFATDSTTNTFKYNEWKQSASGGTTIHNTAGAINLNSGGHLVTVNNGNVTASGNISASGVGTFSSLDIDGNIKLGNNAVIYSEYTNRGRIDLFSSNTSNSAQVKLYGGTAALELQRNTGVEITGDITASGDISASGTVIGHLVPQVPKVEYYTITSSALREETTMTLPNSLTYMTSSGGYEYLEMFADGIRLNRTIDYAEVDTSTVRYLISLPSQSVITYKSLRTV